MNIIITSSGNKVWLIKAFQKALKNKGLVFACDKSQISSTLFIADKFTINCSQIYQEGYYTKFLQYCIDNDIKAIIPTRNEEIEDLSIIKGEMEEFFPGISVIMSDFNAIDICLNKDKFANFCVSHGFPIPKTYFLSEIFLKPFKGSGSIGAKKLNTFENIVQEFVGWPEYTIDVFIHPDGTPISSVPRLRIKTVNGESWVGKTVKSDYLMYKSIDLCKAIGLIWHNTVQCFYNGTDIKFIEVNPRFGGGAPLGFASGAFTPQWIIQILNGETVKPCIGNFKDGLMMYKFTDEVFM